MMPLDVRTPLGAAMALLPEIALTLGSLVVLLLLTLALVLGGYLASQSRRLVVHERVFALLHGPWGRELAFILPPRVVLGVVLSG